MQLEDFQKMKVQIQAELEQALLAAEKKCPGGLQSWLQDLSQGPSESRG